MIDRIFLIKSHLKNFDHSVSIFGSYTRKGPYRDIDLMIGIRPTDFERVKFTLKNADNLGEKWIEEYFCNYSKVEEIDKDDSDSEDNDDFDEEVIPIHISFVPLNEKDFRDTKFWELNQDHLKSVYTNWT